MNERVWLQSGISFVNTIRAISAGILASISIAACDSNQNTHEAPVSKTQNNPTRAGVSTPTGSDIRGGGGEIILPVIWETEEAAYPISHITSGQTANGTTLILASLGDGRAQAFDLDGVVRPALSGFRVARAPGSAA